MDILEVVCSSLGGFGFKMTTAYPERALISGTRLSDCTSLYEEVSNSKLLNTTVEIIFRTAPLVSPSEGPPCCGASKTSSMASSLPALIITADMRMVSNCPDVTDLAVHTVS